MEPNDPVVHLPPAEGAISALAFHGYASDFLQAALAFPTSEIYSPAPYYLLCRALEVGLKAYALARGWSADAVKERLGQDLVQALAKARELGLDSLLMPSRQEEAELARASAYYVERGFEFYPRVRATEGCPDLPDPEVLAGLGTRLLAAIEPACHRC